MLRKRMKMHEIILSGCKPNQFMDVLKTLGVFSVIAEQKDASARSCWKNDRFFAINTKLNEEEIIDFFSNYYRPIPLVSPWNKGSEFYTKRGVVSDIEQCTDTRLEQYGHVIHTARKVAQNVLGPTYKEMLERSNKENKEKKRIEKQFEKHKDIMISTLRNKLPETNNVSTCIRPRSVLSWLDTAWAVKTAHNLTPGPILLTGGNDGNFEMSANFMKAIWKHVINGNSKKEVKLIRNSLFGITTDTTFDEMKVGTYLPGAYMSKAVNSVGDNNYTLCNPWDYILAMEGIVLFAGSIYRRGEYKFASFPFNVKPSHGGYSTAANKNEKGKGEIWAPIWNNPATYDEIAYVFAEGRVQSTTKKPSTGADFAVALTGFGAMRGISSFQRFSVLERKGQACHITSIGRIRTAVRGDTTLQDIRWLEIDKWLGKIRNVDKLPISIETLLHMMDDEIIQYCTHKKSAHLLNILVIIGRIEQHLALSPRLRQDVYPLKNLSSHWLRKCGYDTSEFRLAAALASMYSSNNSNCYPLRYNLEPIEPNNKGYKWRSANSSSVMWGRGSLVQNMIAILERRCYDELADKKQITIKSHIYARIDDVVKFIEGRVNDSTIYDLVFPLSMIDYQNMDENMRPEDKRIDYDDVPESYICLKSNFPPIPNIDESRGLFEPTIISLLKGGRQSEALDIMRRRLIISGRNIVTYKCFSSVDEQNRATALRMCAALLFPIRARDMKKLLKGLRYYNNRSYVSPLYR